MSAHIEQFDALVQKERQDREELSRLVAEQKRFDERHRKLRGAAIRGQPLEGEEPIVFSAIPQKKGSWCCSGGECKGMLADRSTRLAAIVCHPWAALGGSMHDINVLHILDLLGADAQITTLRFNFSSLGIGTGHTSSDDLRGACTFLLSLEQPPERLLVVGYSYGSLVVADVAPTLPEVSAFALVAPPLGYAQWLFMGRSQEIEQRAQRSEKPKFCLLGTHDQFCSKLTFERFSSEMSEPNLCVLAVGAVQEDRCCNHGHAHVHRYPVDHFGIFEHIELHMKPWLEATFGCPLAGLAASDGVAS